MVFGEISRFRRRFSYFGSSFCRADRVVRPYEIEKPRPKNRGEVNRGTTLIAKFSHLSCSVSGAPAGVVLRMLGTGCKTRMAEGLPPSPSLFWPLLSARFVIAKTNIAVILSQFAAKSIAFLKKSRKRKLQELISKNPKKFFSSARPQTRRTASPPSFRPGACADSCSSSPARR